MSIDPDAKFKFKLYLQSAPLCHKNRNKHKWREYEEVDQDEEIELGLVDVKELGGEGGDGEVAGVDEEGRDVGQHDGRHHPPSSGHCCVAHF